MFQRIDPSKLAEEMRIAIVEYKKTQRVFEEIVRLKKEKEDTMYLHYRFFSNEIIINRASIILSIDSILF